MTRSQQKLASLEKQKKIENWLKSQKEEHIEEKIGFEETEREEHFTPI